MRRDQRHRFIRGVTGLVVSAELDVVALDIETAAGVIAAVMKVVPVTRVVYLHDALVTADRNAVSGCGIRLAGRAEVRVCRIAAGIRRDERCSVTQGGRAAVALYEVIDIRLRSVLPAEGSRRRRRRCRRCVHVLICENGTGASRNRVVGPSRNTCRVVNAFKTRAAGPSAGGRRGDLVENLILFCGGNRDQVASHAVQIALLCGVVTVSPAHKACRLRLHIHIIVLRAVIRHRVRNGLLRNLDGCVGREVVLAVSERNLKLLVCTRARKLKLHLLFNEILCLGRRQCGRENELVEQVAARRINIRKALVGLAADHRAAHRHIDNVTRVDLEVHRGDAVAGTVYHGHIAELIRLTRRVSVVVEKLKGCTELGVSGLIVDDREGREVLCRRLQHRHALIESRAQRIHLRSLFIDVKHRYVRVLRFTVLAGLRDLGGDNAHVTEGDRKTALRVVRLNFFARCV